MLSALTLLALLPAGCSDYQVERDNEVAGVGQDILVSPTFLAFDPINRGEASTRSFTITNRGSGTLSIYSVVSGGGTAFVPLADPPPTLAPDESAEVEVQFSPVNPEDVGWIDVYSDDPDTPEIRVELEGSSTLAELAVDPESYDFGDLSPGCALEVPFTITSVGEADLSLDSVQLQGVGYELVEAVEPAVLAPGESVEAWVRFSPEVEGRADGSLVIESDDWRGRQFGELVGEGREAVEITDRFYQGPFERTDILIYIDRSGSMDDDAENLASNFERFMDNLSSWDADYQLIVVTHDNGCYNQVVFTPDQGDAEQFRAAVIENGGINQERGLTLTYTALSAAYGGCNDGFLREGSKTSIILISDEPEQSRGELDELLAGIRELAPTSTISAIAGPVPTGCTTAEPGRGYYEAVNATGGAFFSICAEDWGDYFLDFSDISRGEQLQSFPLSADPDPETIEVQVDGEEIGAWAYDDAENAVVFDAGAIPEPGSEILVRYFDGVVCEQ
jgi:hypothetical protein